MLVTGTCTKKHIEAGQSLVRNGDVAGKQVLGGRAFHCPMCHSVSELVKPDIEVGVTHDRIVFALNPYSPKSKSISVETGDELRAHIAAFDSDETNAQHEPFTYQLDIPAALLR